MSFRISFLMFMGAVLITGGGCAAGSAGGARIPVFQGTPPAAYTYRSLGRVAGEYVRESDSTRIHAVNLTMREAMEKLAEEAAAEGANAVINVRREQGEGTKRHFFRFSGEAVIFERLPSE